MSNAHLVCTALVGTNKVGELKPDADGYYTVILGALDSFNSAGAYYPMNGAEAVFAESSSLQRRVRTGNCRGEYGHPQRAPGQSIQEHMGRCMRIHEPNIAFHVSEVWLDKSVVKGPDGKALVAVMGKIRPCGPMGHVLEAQLKNPKENVCFSVRALTVDTIVAGIIQKVIKQIIGWDYVNEPGIAVATKYHNPALESYCDDIVITEEMLATQPGGSGAVGMSFEHSVLSLEEIRSAIAAPTSKVGTKRPPSADWN